MRQLFILLQKEFIQIKRDPFISKLIFGFPILVMLIMPWITTMDIRNVEVTIVDKDNSSLSRRITNDVKASEYFTLTPSASSYNEAKQMLENLETDIILLIPENFERNLSTPSAEKIDISANAVNATKGSLGSQYLVQTIMKSIAGKNPSDFVIVKNFYNETLNYKYLMIPALMIILLILICGFLSAVSIVVEKENGTIEQINVTPISRFTFTLAKLIPFWLIGLFVISIAMLVAWLVYGLSPAGSIGYIYLASILFILAFSGFGVTIANKSDNIQQTMFVMFFFLLTFMLLSGLLTPISSMPQWAQYITIILPPRYFIDIMRSVYLKGSDFMDLWQNFLALGIFAIAFNLLAAVTYKKQN